MDSEEKIPEDIIFSVVMPTFNSEKTIRMSLDSIRAQNVDQNKVEIIVVDGGSSDLTVEIAKKHKAIILSNPYRLPEPAKLIGMHAARGKFLSIMDSDEVLVDTDMFKKRLNFFSTHKNIHGLIVDLAAPDSFNSICTYMNQAGDPFSCFIYKRWGKIEYNLKKNLVYSDSDGHIYKYKEQDLIPIGDANIVFDLNYVREELSNELETHEPAVLWDVLIKKSKYIGYVYDDYMLHYSECDFRTYLKKLRFRIINNIHDVSGSGYAFRAQENKKLNRRKYLFPFYCVSVILPVWDGVHMSVLHRNWSFLCHPIFAWYVMLEICFEYIKKVMGIKSVNKKYGN